ncbi:hypothetical protein MHY1_02100 [Methylovirgula sp. HY1]|nr:hypothetical protein MHY1_02100 [Methylovirgula sp. HY1]
MSWQRLAILPWLALPGCGRRPHAIAPQTEAQLAPESDIKTRFRAGGNDTSYVISRNAIAFKQKTTPQPRSLPRPGHRISFGTVSQAAA